MWFDRKPGDTISIGSEEEGDPSTLLLASTDALPDWIKTPPQLGPALRRDLGHSSLPEKLRVIRRFMAMCPMCTTENLVRHIECSESLFVAECAIHGFVWYKERKK